MKSTCVRWLLWIAVTAAALLGVLPKSAAQNNAICTTITGCTQQQPSPAFLDASVGAVQQPDLCQTIYGMLKSPNYPVTGAVIDARGLPAGIVSMVCAPGKSPWFDGTTYVNKPSTILLPAATITIPSTWVPGAPGSRPFFGR